ncbi:hypothetical protein [Palaeococcus ferrophilus]|uniref:hypothetical protein n=1 Tax=Palaeococcus ferrophilus TaxID=83868 RepID=UPI00064E9249|nr:hypothetical protein [Palaeococcus ferrophilus]
MFEWFFFLSLALSGWLIYEITKDKVRGYGRYWVTMNVEGDADRLEYLIKQLAKDQKIKIRSFKISAEKPSKPKRKKFFGRTTKKEEVGPK